MQKKQFFQFLGSRLLCLLCLMSFAVSSYGYFSTIHYITVKINPENGGTVTHNGKNYANGSKFRDSSVTSGLRATAKAGYTFTGWSLSGDLQKDMFTSSSNSYIEVACGIEGKVTATANFTAKTPGISFNSYTNGINNKWLNGNTKSITIGGSVSNADAVDNVEVSGAATGKLSINNGNWSYTINLSGETSGTKYVFKVKHRDDSSNNASVTFTLKRDVTNPKPFSQEINGTTYEIDDKLYLRKGSEVYMKFQYTETLSGIDYYMLGKIRSNDCSIKLTNEEGLFQSCQYYAVDKAGNSSITGQSTYRVDGTAPSVSDVSIQAKSSDDDKFIYKDSAGKVWIKVGIETVVKATIVDPVSTNVCSGLKSAIMNENVTYTDDQFVLNTDALVYNVDNINIVATDKVDNVNTTNIGVFGTDNIAPNIHFDMPITVDDIHDGKSWSGVQYKGYRFASTPAGERIDYDGKSFDIQESGEFTFVAADNVNNEVSYTLVASADKHSVMYNDTVIYASVDENGKLVIPDGAKVIRKNLMKDSLTLKELVIPESVNLIEEDAFSGCKNLKKADIKSEEIDMPSDAFDDTDPDLVINLDCTLKPSDEYTNKNTLNWDLTGDPTGKFENYQNLKNEGKLTITVNPNDVSGNEYVLATGDMSDLTNKNTFTLTGIVGEDDVDITVGDDAVTYNGKGYKLFLEGSGDKAKLVLRVVETYTLVLKGGKSYISTDNGSTIGNEVNIAGLTYDATAGWTMNNFTFHTSATQAVHVQDEDAVNITLMGENVISSGGGKYMTTGMSLFGKTYFKGTGTLSVTAGNAKGTYSSFGIYSYKHLYVHDAVLNVTAKSGTTSKGISADLATLTGSARVTVQGQSQAVQFFTPGISPTASAQWDKKVLEYNLDKKSYYNGTTVATKVLLTKVFADRFVFNKDREKLGKDDKDTIYTAAPYDGNGGAVCVNENDTLDAQKVIFANNAAIGDKDGNGGALYTEDNSVVNLDSVSFLDNSAEHDGGAVYNNGKLTMDNDANFTRNIAGDNGGAIFNTDSLTMNGKATFTDNSAGIDGGAINNTSTGNITMKDDVVFDGNKAGNDGGAINNDGNITMENDATFTGNEAGNDGGAINNTGNISIGGNADFTGNKAGNDGGAINNDGKLEIDGDANFANNEAKGDGGAVNNTDTLIVKGNATFTGNLSGGDGGAVNNEGYMAIEGEAQFTSNESEGDGGAINNDGKLEIGGGATFASNEAGGDGGAINNTDSLVVKGDATFTGNKSGGDGGAVNNEGYMAIEGNAEFASNEAVGNGGAINNTDSLIVKGNATFTGNKSGGDGGAVNNEGYMAIEGNAEFTSNESEGNGGAINNTGKLEIGGDATFAGNHAGGDGGAINNTDTITVKGKADFTGNSADGNGGAINNSGCMTFDDETTFSGNNATQGGAIFNDGTLNFNGPTTFSGNNATNGGGAIYNNGTINMSNKVTLATATDSIYNKGTMNWNLQGDPYGTLENYQYLNNDGGKLALSINPDDQLGDSFVIATGDFSDVTGKDVFTLTGVDGQPDVDIVINGGAYYNGKFYTLTVEDGKLVLRVSPEPSYEEFFLDTSWSTKRQGEMIEVEGKTYYYGLNVFSSTQEAIDKKKDDTQTISMDAITDEIKKDQDLGNTTLLVNDASLTIAEGKKLTGGNVEVSSTEEKSVTLKGEIGSNVTLKDGVTLGAGTNVYFNDNVQLEKEATFTGGAVVEKYGLFEVGNEDTLNINKSTLKTRTESIMNNGTMNLTESTLNSSAYPVVNNADMNVNAGTTTITSTNSSYAFFNGEKAVLNLEKDAVLAFTGNKNVHNAGEINLNGGTFADDVVINNTGDLNWDIRNKVASVIKWNNLHNYGNLGIITNMVQPKDTTYKFADTNLTPGCCVGAKFVLRGYKEKIDTLTMGAFETDVKGYGNRMYRVQIEEGELRLRVLPGVCKIRETFYNTIDEAIAAVQEGDTIQMLTNIEMENSLEMPAGTYLNLAGFTLTNPAGLNLTWDLTSDKAPVIQDFDKLAADGTLTLKVNDFQTRKEYIIANDVTNISNLKFTLPANGSFTFDLLPRYIKVDNCSVFYGHRHYSFKVNSNKQLVLTVTKVTPADNEFWVVSNTPGEVTLTNDGNFNVSYQKSEFMPEDNITRFQFNDAINRVGVAALKGNLNIKELYLPESVEYISQDAFRDCENLELVSMLDVKGTAIGPNAFERCKKLKLIEWPEKLQDIDAFGFAYCESLEDITLPKTLSSIYGNAFSFCSSLKSVTLQAESMERIWAESFDKCHEDLTVYVPADNIRYYESIQTARGLNFQSKFNITTDAMCYSSVYFHHNIILPAGLTACGYTYDKTNHNINYSSVIVNWSEDQVLAGGQGYVLASPSPNKTYLIVSTDEEANAIMKSDLTGLLEPTPASTLMSQGTLYEPISDSFYEVTDNSKTIEPRTAFMLVNGSGTPLKFNYDPSTGIQYLDVEANAVTDADDASFNTAGQKVANGYKGIVIKNGNKYLNK